MKKSDYDKLMDEISILYLNKGKDEVTLNGVTGETFFVNHKIEILGIFQKDNSLWLRLSDRDRDPLDTRLERRLDDFTYWTLLDIKKGLE